MQETREALIHSAGCIRSRRRTPPRCGSQRWLPNEIGIVLPHPRVDQSKALPDLSPQLTRTTPMPC